MCRTPRTSCRNGTIEDGADLLQSREATL
ncbi:hypothetical protein AZE42_10778 [Rhizopogon vesiculosus]|uniref:Uncharacterized protein n=1 Tax=Rhizopogon vesiculosus TaxID=180088 RepID=A0A1J8QRD3_9AGAM|nr:hypothetical protein AZE42_10778 [Rhizopogon vesiculosus]